MHLHLRLHSVSDICSEFRKLAIRDFHLNSKKCATDSFNSALKDNGIPIWQKFTSHENNFYSDTETFAFVQSGFAIIFRQVNIRSTHSHEKTHLRSFCFSNHKYLLGFSFRMRECIHNESVKAATQNPT